GFRGALRGDQRQDGARGGARSLRPPGAAEPALVGLEYVRRAGRVLAEPGRDGEVISPRTLSHLSRLRDRDERSSLLGRRARESAAGRGKSLPEFRLPLRGE